MTSRSNCTVLSPSPPPPALRSSSSSLLRLDKSEHDNSNLMLGKLSTSNPVKPQNERTIDSQIFQVGIPAWTVPRRVLFKLQTASQPEQCNLNDLAGSIRRRLPCWSFRQQTNKHDLSYSPDLTI